MKKRFMFILNNRKTKVQLLPPPCSVEKLKSILHYNPETGQFKYLIKNNHVYPGMPAGFITSKGYISVSIKGTAYKAHKLAWYYMTGEWILVDHKDRIRSHNAIENLRPANHYQNASNRDCNSTNFMKGVSKDRKGFRARITVKGKCIYLGHFFSVEKANAAYCKAAKLYHGEFANY